MYYNITFVCPPSPPPLQELLKYTSEDHPDRPHVEASVHAMKQVAMHINEGKRRLENIGRIGKWQETIENWKVCVYVTAVEEEMVLASNLL